MLEFLINFSLNLEISHHNRYLRACDDQNDKNQEQESKKIIKFIFPNRFIHISKTDLMTHLMTESLYSLLVKLPKSFRFDQSEAGFEMFPVKIKNNSIKTAPKGSIPAISIEVIEFINHCCSGIWR